MNSITANCEWKAVGGDSGELEGSMSTFGNVDQGGDVVLPGAFKKTFADWSRAKSPMPLLADHQLSTDGVIGSVRNMVEDGHGARIRARFSTTAEAQDIRTRMLEGHWRGMSFTYQPMRSHPGEKDGRRVRFLDEVKVFEATVTPFPMNELALASAKDRWDGDDVTAQLDELERWARGDEGGHPLRLGQREVVGVAAHRRREGP